MGDERVEIEVVGGPSLTVPRGQPLMQALRAAGVPVATECGGRGICHLCRVWIRDGELPEPARVERRALGNVLVEAGMRLSCRVRVEGPLRIELEGPEEKTRE